MTLESFARRRRTWDDLNSLAFFGGASQRFPPPPLEGATSPLSLTVTPCIKIDCWFDPGVVGSCQRRFDCRHQFTHSRHYARRNGVVRSFQLRLLVLASLALADDGLIRMKGI